jgi:hypothetical protein
VELRRKAIFVCFLLLFHFANVNAGKKLEMKKNWGNGRSTARIERKKGQSNRKQIFTSSNGQKEGGKSTKLAIMIIIQNYL